MGLQDAVKRLTEGNSDEVAEEAPTIQEEESKEPEVETLQENPACVDESSTEENRDEWLVAIRETIEISQKLLFKHSAIIDKMEVDRKEMKKVYEAIDQQKDTVGKMLVGLESLTQTIPAAANAGVKEAVEKASVSINEASTRISSALTSHSNAVVKQLVTSLNEHFASSVAAIKSAASETSAAANKAKSAVDHVGWSTLGMNLLISFIVILVALGVINRRLPWNLRGPSPEEKAYILRGKAVSEVWPQLSPKLQEKISRIIDDVK